ncbi:hypothetical protein [Xanthomonas sp. 3058]|nr:hypothetical protein [Xanthomonas sp. 3058]MBB5864748.1 hypothetical protein [Xanthomonas sp. 3058]
MDEDGDGAAKAMLADAVVALDAAQRCRPSAVGGVWRGRVPLN